MKLVLVAALVLFGGAFASAQQAGGGQKPKDATEVPRIPLAEAKQAYDTSSAVFVDARSPDTYKSEHIKGAINIPLSDPKFDSLPKAKTIIVYCS